VICGDLAQRKWSVLTVDVDVQATSDAFLSVTSATETTTVVTDLTRVIAVGNCVTYSYRQLKAFPGYNRFRGNGQKFA